MRERRREEKQGIEVALIVEGKVSEVKYCIEAGKRRERKGWGRTPGREPY